MNSKISIYIIIFILMITCSLTAQEFASIGSTWTYRTNFLGVDSPIAYKYEVNKDTVIESKKLHIIEKFNLFRDSGWVRTEEKEMVSSAGDSVLILINDSLHLIFDFSAQPGDTIAVVEHQFNGFFAETAIPEIFLPQDFSYRIDSIGWRQIDGDSLRVQYVSYEQDFDPYAVSYWGFQDIVDRVQNSPGEIIAGIGATSRFSMLGTSSDVSYFIDEAPDRLACYQGVKRSYQFIDLDCDVLVAPFITSTSQVLSPTANIKIYPNPFTNYINIENEESTFDVTIRDIHGRVVICRLDTSKNINLSHLTSGIYYLSLVDQAGQQVISKIIKQ